MSDRIDPVGRNVATFSGPLDADMHQVHVKARQFATVTADLKAACATESAHSNTPGNVSIAEADCRLRDAIGQAPNVITSDQLRTILEQMRPHSDRSLSFGKE